MDTLKTFPGHTIEIPPPSLVIDMTELDEICARAQDVLEILKQIEL